MDSLAQMLTSHISLKDPPEKEDVITADWSRLPQPLLELIYERVLPSDHLGFSSVCTFWRSVAIGEGRYLPHKFIGLIAPGKTKDSETRRLFEPLVNSNINGPLRVSVPHSYYVCGSSFGWLVLVDNSLDIQLFNPFSGAKIQLPSSTSLPQPMRDPAKYHVDKAILSCDPCSTSCQTIVFVKCWGVGFAFCKPGDKAWTPIESDGRIYQDAIFYKEKFFVVEYTGSVVVWDIANADHPKMTDHALKPPGEIFATTRYLVESNGYLFQLRRNIQFDVETYDDSTDSDYYENAEVVYGGENHGEEVENGHSENENSDNNDKIDPGSDKEEAEDGHSENENSDNNDMNDKIDPGSDKEEVEGEPVKRDDGDNSDQNDEVDHVSNCGKIEIGDVKRDDSGDKNDLNDEVDLVSDKKEVGDGLVENNNGDNNDLNNEVQIESESESESGESLDQSRKEELMRYRTSRFKTWILRMCVQCNREEWQKVESIGDNAFFVGYSSSFSVSASDILGCKSNCIYFTDSKAPIGNWPDPFRHDIGVYNLQDKSVQEIYPIDSKPVSPVPFWCTPMPLEDN